MHVLIGMHQSDKTLDSGQFLGEEQAFWTLVCAFDALGVEGYYTDRMLLLRSDMQVLQAFMKVKCPKVAKVAGGAGGTWGLGGGPCLSNVQGIVSIFLTKKVIWIHLRRYTGIPHFLITPNIRNWPINRLMVDPSLDGGRNHTFWTCKVT